MRNRVKLLIRERARELRHHATPVERLLWRSLRELNREGFHFRRQVPFRGFILDFAEHGRKVVIELDGDSHYSEKRIARDARRDRVLADEGYRVLRFKNFEVRDGVDGVIRTILLEIGDRLPP
jgi:very-short-patch-repair endonuclease